MTHLGNVQFQNVYPALAECFLLTLAGYIAGRINLISPKEAKGLNIFVSHFSLPALIFYSLATLHLDSVNWSFLLCILVAKALVFVLVAVLTMVIQKPVNLGKAGLFAIFCTQSNDFALGYPIVEALYHEVHPDFSNYLYLVAPISLVLLNPIGFVMLEVQARRQTHEGRRALHLALNVVKGIVTNPVVLMTILGVGGNFAFKQNVPQVLAGILKVLGSAFSATALFSLGLKMVGKLGNLKRHDITICAILIAIKILILPLIIRETVLLINPGATHNETVELGTYGFLYGTFPTAPGIFVFAMQYNIAADLIATAVSGCTLLAAPFILVSAKMISLHFSVPTDYLPEFQTLLFNISIVSFIGCLWTLVVFFTLKRWRRMPQWITLWLLLSQMLICIGIILWKSLGDDSQQAHDVQFLVFTTGVYASRVWTALLALGILLLRWRSLCFLLRLKWVFFVAGWGIPISMSLIMYCMLIRDDVPINKLDPYFLYGTSQAVASSLVLFCCLCLTVLCLVTQQRFENCCEYQSLLGSRAGAPQVGDGLSANPGCSHHEIVDPFKTCHDNCKHDEGSCTLQDVEDLLLDSNDRTHQLVSVPNEMCSINSGCEVRRQECASLIKNYMSVQNDDAEVEDDGYEFVSHTVLLYMLCLSMFVGLSVCLWRIVLEDITGIYVELEFLDGILNIGQGFFMFIVLGTNVNMINKIVNCWRRINGPDNSNCMSN